MMNDSRYINFYENRVSRIVYLASQLFSSVYSVAKPYYLRRGWDSNPRGSL